jgi:RNA polymerase sigma factor (sigma-70 family)
MMRDDQSVVALVTHAAAGDESAWNHTVWRYAPLVRSVCGRFRVTKADADDVAGVVWLRLVASLTTIRQPAALPGWIATTAHRECLALLRDRNRQIQIGDHEFPTETEPASDSRLLIEESHRALREAFAQLSDRDRRLLAMLFSDPPMSYIKISNTLSIPVGAIGPTRQRCLARLRRNPHLAALLADDWCVKPPAPTNVTRHDPNGISVRERDINHPVEPLSTPTTTAALAFATDGRAVKPVDQACVVHSELNVRLGAGSGLTGDPGVHASRRTWTR